MRRRALVVAAAIAVATGFWITVVTLLGAGTTPTGAVTEPSLPTAHPAARQALAVHRVPVEEPRPDAATLAPTTPADFDAAVDELVTLGMEIHRALERDDEDAAFAANRIAESTVLRTITAHRDAGTLALDRLVRHQTRTSIACGVRARVLERLLGDDLRARHARRSVPLDGPTLDALVAAMLAFVPATPELADALGGRLLTARPYLGHAHEAAVLELSDRTTELPFLLDVVPGLLRTLWQNIESMGGSPSSRLRGLALLFLEDPNPARRQAAAVRLLADPSHRGLAVEATIRAGDADLAAAVGRAAATELPATDALDVLSDIHDVGGEGLIPAFVALGMRAPSAMVAAYEQRLADGVGTALRRSLLTAATATLDPAGLAVAELALHSDPDPEIRSRALFALAADPDVRRAEQVLHAALDDPAHRGDPSRAGQVALALRNLAGPGAREARQRVADRLRLHPALGERDRRALEAWLTTHQDDAR